MNTTLRNTLIVLAVLVLAGALFFAGSVYARTSVFRPFNMMGYFDKDVNTYGPSMMRGNGNGYGPGMMTNGRGSMMGGSGYGGPRGSATPPSAQPMAKDRARQFPMQYLAQAFPGSALDDGTAFYGYFTFDIQRGGKPVGMLSVNAFTGAVWYHHWHGTFVAEKDF